MATRRERVVLELEDQFTTGMAKAAASAALLNRELDSLSKDSVRTRRSISDIDQPVQGVGRSADTSSKQIDKLSGRVRILADVAAILGPALIPVGAIGVPAVTGLAAQLGFAATAAGTTVLAFQGVGNALKTLNVAALNPTQENLQKAQIALEALSPAAQGFVTEVGRMLPQLKQLRDVAAGGLFPGMTEGLDAMVTALPHVRGLIASVSTELGHISLNIGEALASDRWTSFLDFLGQEAPKALAEMATAAGSTAHAVASLWVATNPLNQDFSKWLVEATADIDRWATSLGKTQGFADFLNYVETTGPKVADAFGAIANAVVQILQAASPLGGPVLEGVKALADVVAAIANSDLGTPLFVAVGALALFNRTLGLMKATGSTAFGGFIVGEAKAAAGIRTMIADLQALKAEARLVTLPSASFIGPLTRAETAAQRLRTSLPAFGKTALAVGGLAVAATGAADSLGLTNAASLGLMGSLGGPVGAVIGTAVGATIDFKHANDDLEAAIRRVNAAARAGDFSALKQAADDLRRMRADASTTTGVGDFINDSVKKIGFGISHPGAFAFSSGLRSHIDNAISAADAEARSAEAARRSAASQVLLASGFRATSEGAKQATESVTAFRDGLLSAQSALSGRQSVSDYLASLRAFRKGLKDNGKTLDPFTEKGAANQENLRGIASTALKAAQDMDPVKATAFLDNVRASFIKAAVSAGMARGEAKNFATEVGLINGLKGVARLEVDDSGALEVLDNLTRRLRQVPRKLRIDVIVNQSHANAINSQIMDIHNGKAGGGTIGGNRYPYADKVLVPLAPGEEVITNRNGEADKWRPFLKRINAGLANGGTVPFTSAGAMGPAIDYERLARAMAAVRPMYGDVTVQPHDYNEFRRQMQQDRRLGSLDGRRS